MKLREAKSVIFSSAEHCLSPAPDACVHWVAQSWQNPGSCKYHLHPVKLSCAAVCPHGPCLFVVFRISDILLTDFDNIVSHVHFEIYTSYKNEGFQCFHFKTGHEWPAVPWAHSTHQTSSQSRKGVPWSSIIYHKMAFCLTFRMFGSFFWKFKWDLISLELREWSPTSTWRDKCVGPASWWHGDSCPEFKFNADDHQSFTIEMRLNIAEKKDTKEKCFFSSENLEQTIPNKASRVWHAVPLPVTIFTLSHHHSGKSARTWHPKAS